MRCPVSPASSFAAASSVSFVRATITTSAPSRASSRAIALPMPRLPPVTIACLPFRPRSIATSLRCRRGSRADPPSSPRGAGRARCAMPPRPAVISRSPWRPMITTSSPTAAPGTPVRSTRVCSSDGAPTIGTARPRTSTRPAWSHRRPSAEPIGITPSRIGAVTGNGASSANRSRGVSSLSAMTRDVSARNDGPQGHGRRLLGERDAVQHAAGIDGVEVRVREAQHPRRRGDEPHGHAHPARLQLVDDRP